MASRALSAAGILLIGMLLMYVCWPLYDLIGAPLTATDEVQVSYLTGNDNTSVRIASDNYAYQTFLTTEAFTLTHVKVRLYRVGAPGTVTCYIETTSGGTPTGTIATTGTYAGTSITALASGEWVDFDVADADVAASTMYAIVIRASGNSANHIYWQIDSSSPTYTGGTYGFSVDAGVTWF
jgi:hypothetical protein